MLVLGVYKLPYGSVSKVSACSAGDPGLISGMERSLTKKWQPTPVFLDWEIPWTEEPGGLQSMGSRVRQDLKTKSPPPHSDLVFLQIILHCKLLQDNGYNSLYYTVYVFLLLTILYTVFCMC